MPPCAPPSDAPGPMGNETLINGTSLGVKSHGGHSYTISIRNGPSYTVILVIHFRLPHNITLFVSTVDRYVFDRIIVSRLNKSMERNL